MYKISTGRGQEVISATQLKNMAAPGAVQDDGNMQKSPLMGSLREKEGQHPVLEVYYFHISWYVCEPLGMYHSILSLRHLYPKGPY